MNQNTFGYSRTVLLPFLGLSACTLEPLPLEQDAAQESPLQPVRKVITIANPPKVANTVLTEAIPVRGNNNNLQKTRGLRVECEWRCTHWEWEHDYAFGTELRECTAWREDCGSGARRGELYPDFAQMGGTNDWPYQAAAAGPYHGCGVDAIRNVLEFYGANAVTEADIRARLTTYSISSNKIAILPAELERALRDELSRRVVGTFVVTRVSGADPSRIRSELSQGNPVIALVDEGNHYQLVTGYALGAGTVYSDVSSPHSYYVLDRGGSEWVNDMAVNLDFPSWPALPAWGQLAGNLLTSGGYYSGTLIIVERTSASSPPPPPSSSTPPPAPGTACPSGKHCCNPGPTSCNQCIPNSQMCP
jgi:hypothetical protein